MSVTAGALVEGGKPASRAFSNNHLAWLFLVIQILVASELVYHPSIWPVFFWYCNHISLFFAYALYSNRPQMVIGLAEVGFFVQVVWLADFLCNIFGIKFVGITNYMFDSSWTYIKTASLLIHISIPTVALISVRQNIPRLVSLVYSFVYLISMYFVALLVVPSNENVNCAFRPCAPIFPEWHYNLLYIFYAGIYCILCFILFRILSKFFRRLHPLKKSYLDLYYG